MPNNLQNIELQWQEQWPQALALWSRFTKLSPPLWLSSKTALKREGMSGSFAAIRLFDHAVMIDVQLVEQLELGEFGLEVLAHEIGHHVLAPGDIHDNARLMARIRYGLPTQEQHAPMIANLYTDLLINDRLQRGCDLDMAQVYRHLDAHQQNPQEPSRLWTLYLRIYEIAWNLSRGDLAKGKVDAALDVDAGLGARLIRAYAGDWLRGGGRFAMLCLPYLIEDEEKAGEQIRVWLDTRNAGRGGQPDGLIDIDPDEIDGAIHPSEDPLLSSIAASENDNDEEAEVEEIETMPQSHGQCREPFEYGQLLKALGIAVDDHELAVRYYRERARPHLIRFPVQSIPQTSEPLPEGFTPWELGEPMEEIDWLQSTITAPRIVPGLTTLQRTWGESPGQQEESAPIDLDLYVDCSGSMPNPQAQTSFLALAGAIVVLSALRVGARVQATLWSGANQFQTTGCFTRDESAILRIVTGFIGGATAFPIHILRDTFQNRTKADRAAHILILSDDGVTTMFDKDERGNSGWEIACMALEHGRAGGTMALNLWRDWETMPELQRAHNEGWAVHRLSEWDELTAFARAFSKAHYEKAHYEKTR